MPSLPCPCGRSKFRDLLLRMLDRRIQEELDAMEAQQEAEVFALERVVKAQIEEVAE